MLQFREVDGILSPFIGVRVTLFFHPQAFALAFINAHVASRRPAVQWNHKMSKSEICGVAVTLFLALWNMQSTENGWQVNTILNFPITINQYK